VDLGLEGRVAAVTGASSGIGRATALQLCAEGSSVLLIGRHEGRLKEAAEVAEGLGAGSGAGVATLALDVTVSTAGEQIMAAAEARFGALDVLVNSAGSAKWRDLQDVPDADWQAQYELSVMAPMRAMRAAAPKMADRGWGRIVNVCSIAAKRPVSAMPDYTVAKAAELALTKLFANRYAEAGVLVNAICPGSVESEMWLKPGGLLDQSQQLARFKSREEALADAKSRRPIARFADPDEIAAVITFLCSNQASYVSGVAWSVDGGAVPIAI
jgi:3-oxoacyl-[acyl-carrier protein] reductase